MMPGAQSTGRLKARNDFERVAAAGKRARHGVIGLIYHPNGLELSRIGISVPERTSKSAVRRNRLKRVVRESIRTKLQALTGGYDIIITILKDPGSSESAVLKGDLLKALIKSGLWEGAE